MHNSNTNVNNESETKGKETLSLEARHSIAAEKTRKIRESVNNPLFIPKAKVREQSDNSKVCSSRVFNTQKPQTKAGNKTSLNFFRKNISNPRKFKHPESFPIVPKELPSIQNSPLVQSLRGHNVHKLVDNSEDNEVVIVEKSSNMLNLDAIMDKKHEEISIHDPATIAVQQSHVASEEFSNSNIQDTERNGVLIETEHNTNEDKSSLNSSSDSERLYIDTEHNPENVSFDSTKQEKISLHPAKQNLEFAYGQTEAHVEYIPQEVSYIPTIDAKNRVVLPTPKSTLTETQSITNNSSMKQHSTRAPVAYSQDQSELVIVFGQTETPSCVENISQEVSHIPKIDPIAYQSELVYGQTEEPLNSDPRSLRDVQLEQLRTMETSSAYDPFQQQITPYHTNDRFVPNHPSSSENLSHAENMESVQSDPSFMCIPVNLRRFKRVRPSWQPNIYPYQLTAATQNQTRYSSSQSSTYNPNPQQTMLTANLHPRSTTGLNQNFMHGVPTMLTFFNYLAQYPNAPDIQHLQAQANMENPLMSPVQQHPLLSHSISSLLEPPPPPSPINPVWDSYFRNFMYQNYISTLGQSN